MKKKIGNILLIVAIVFALGETYYFGSEWLPESTAEFICDSIALMIGTVGATLKILHAYEKNKRKNIYKI